MDSTHYEESSPAVQPALTATPLPPSSRATSTALDRALFAPALLLAVVVVLLTGTASLCIPLREVIVPVQWILLLALGGWFYVRRATGTARPMLLLTVLACFACYLGLADYTGKLWWDRGDVLSMHVDNWSYHAIADYLYRYPRGRIDGMPLVDEFGAHLRNTRFATPALLCLLQRTLVLRDLPMAYLLFVGGCFVAHFFSVLALGRALVRRVEWSGPLFAAFLSTAGGWLTNALRNANNDNLIFAALTPALLAVLCSVAEAGDDQPARVRLGRIAAGMLFLGAMIYNYPEGIALLGVMTVPLAVTLLWPAATRRATLNRWVETLGIVALGICAAIPYLPTFIYFLHLQFLVGTVAGMRPADGALPGLVNARRLPATFVLGEEMQGVSYGLLNNVLPLILLALLVLGARALGRRQRWFPWVAAPLGLLYLWQNILKHYDYGTFKVLICAQWWIYLGIGAGCSWVCVRFTLPTAARVAVFAALLLAVGYEKYEDRVLLPPLMSASQIQDQSELASLRFVIGQGPLLLDIADNMDYDWATYYLRGTLLAFWQHRGYLTVPQVAPYLARSLYIPPAACPYMLVEGVRPGALWHNRRFSLLAQPPLYVTGLNPPNGVEPGFFWVGTKPATIEVVANHTGPYQFSVAEFGMGPSAPDQTRLAVEIVDAQGPHAVEITPDTKHLPITLAQGKNVFQIRCLGVPLPGPHNGDSRELMLVVREARFDQP